MLKNREIRVCLSVIILGITIMAAVLYYYPQHRVLTGLLFGAFFLIIFLSFTAWRYKKIAELSTYLSDAAKGGMTLDLRDYAEGELSYLKSEIYKVTLKLTEQADMLIQDKAYLSNTLSDISHQLKTPLTSMFMMTDLLKNPDLPADKRNEFTTNIYRQLERIEWLVSSLLKMSKLDANAVVLKKEKVIVRAVIEKALDHLLVPMELLGQRLIIEGSEEAAFIGDYSWSAEAITNILKNCIEHMPEQGILKISYGNQSIYTWIMIEDNGEGISEQDLPHIFERFYRGTNSKADSVGIGLAMSKQIISQQGGKIEVQSQLNQGSVFLIKLYHQVV